MERKVGFTRVFVVDKRKDPPGKFLFEKYGYIPAETNLEKYFAENAVYNYATFKQWLWKANMMEHPLAVMPAWQTCSDAHYLIIVTIAQHEFTMEVLRPVELELKLPPPSVESTSRPIGRSGTSPIKIGGLGKTKKDLRIFVNDLRKKGWTDDQIESQLPGFKENM
jgi:hypothetical protein